MKIQIMSRPMMAHTIINSAEKLNLIVIRDPNEEGCVHMDADYKNLLCSCANIGTKNAKESITLEFHDFQKAEPGRVLAKRNDVERVLEFSKGKEQILLACAAGISRSSALAYIIARSIMSREDSLKVLDVNIHWPNRHILALGEEILGLPLVKEIDDAGFYRKKN